MHPWEHTERSKTDTAYGELSFLLPVSISGAVFCTRRTHTVCMGAAKPSNASREAVNEHPERLVVIVVVVIVVVVVVVVVVVEYGFA